MIKQLAALKALYEKLDRRIDRLLERQALVRDGLDGQTGPEGPQGAQGSQGDVGPEGPQGETGPAGLQGEKGERGDVGERGPRGLTGRSGIDGEVGQRGPAGPAGRQGPAGPQGRPGPRGQQGPRGPRGQDGTSITRVEIDKNNNLNVWLGDTKKRAGKLPEQRIIVSGGGGGGRSGGGSGDGVQSVGEGRCIEITGTATDPVVNLGAVECETLSHFVYDPNVDRLVSDVPIETTLDSLFLGGQHKLSSGGENVFFTELTNNINYVPCFSGLLDQYDPANQGPEGLIAPFARVYSDNAIFLELSGPESSPLVYTDSGSQFTLGVNLSNYGFSFRPEQPLVPGTQLQFNVYAGLDDTGLKIYEQNLTISAVQAVAAEDLFEWRFDHPIEGFVGNEFFSVTMVTYPGGTPELLRLSQNAAGTAPYSRSLIRFFEDKPIAFQDQVTDWLPWWHIEEGETVTTPDRKEYALHGEFWIDGEFFLEGESRLILED